MHDPSLYDTYQASTTPSRQPVKRSDLEAALSKADRFIRLTDYLLATKYQIYDMDTNEYTEEEWLETWQVAGSRAGHIAGRRST